MLLDTLREIDRECGLTLDMSQTVMSLTLAIVFQDNNLPALHVWPDTTPSITRGEAPDDEIAATMRRYQVETWDDLSAAIEQQIVQTYAEQAAVERTLNDDSAV